MTERFRSLVLFFTATVLIVSAGAHAWNGRLLVHDAMNGSPAGGDATALLQAGWQLGSVSLFAFGLLVLTFGLARRSGRPVAPTTLWIVAVVLAGYGAAALALGDRGFAVYYVAYMVIGALVGFGAGPARAEGTIP